MGDEAEEWMPTLKHVEQEEAVEEKPKFKPTEIIEEEQTAWETFEKPTKTEVCILQHRFQGSPKSCFNNGVNLRNAMQSLCSVHLKVENNEDLSINWLT